MHLHERERRCYVITKQQKEMLTALKLIGPVSAKGLRLHLIMQKNFGCLTFGSVERSAFNKRLRCLRRLWLVHNQYLNLSSPRVYWLTTLGKVRLSECS